MLTDDQQNSNSNNPAPEIRVEVQEFLRNGCFFAINQTDVLIGWGVWRRSAAAESNGCSVFTPDFYLRDEKPWRSPAHFQVINRDVFTRHVLPKLRSEVNSQILERGSDEPVFEQRFQWVEPEREGFERQVLAIRSKFENGALEKAVPIVHAQAREIMTQDRLVAILDRMNQAPESLIPQGFWDEKEGAGLLGATPERLFSIDKENRLQTMALAGTRAKSPSGEGARELLSDPKERHEHQIVVDDLKARLSVYGTIEVGETGVAELPTLFHLKTPISVTVPNPDFATLARALHPTPALGIAPRSFDFQNMKEWDDVSLRGRYGAPFGICLRTKEFAIQDCLVAIRNVQWSNSSAPTLGSGCGFVEESVTDQEWAELKLKRDSVQKVLHV
jgi:menaquinone-specific isochorismate synthase